MRIKRYIRCEPASTRKSSPGIPAHKIQRLKIPCGYSASKSLHHTSSTDKNPGLSFKIPNKFQPSDKQSPCVPPTPCLPNVIDWPPRTDVSPTAEPHYRNAHHACILPVENRIVLIPVPAKILPRGRLLDVVKIACVEKRMRVQHIVNSQGGGTFDHHTKRAERW